MRLTSVLAIAVVVVLAWQVAMLGDPASATQPIEAQSGDVRIQSLKPYSYAYVSQQTSFNQLQAAIGALLPKVDAAVDAGKLRPMGTVIFTYHAASNNPSQSFMLDIGAIVKDDSQAPDGFQLEKVSTKRCATVIYCGSVKQLPDAYGKLYGEIAKRGLRPTDVSREFYLYWEGPDSPNNIIQLQAELAD